MEPASPFLIWTGGYEARFLLLVRACQESSAEEKSLQAYNENLGFDCWYFVSNFVLPKIIPPPSMSSCRKKMTPEDLEEKEEEEEDGCKIQRIWSYTTSPKMKSLSFLTTSYYSTTTELLRPITAFFPSSLREWLEWDKACSTGRFGGGGGNTL